MSSVLLFRWHRRRNARSRAITAIVKVLGQEKKPVTLARDFEEGESRLSFGGISVNLPANRVLEVIIGATTAPIEMGAVNFVIDETKISFLTIEPRAWWNTYDDLIQMMELGGVGREELDRLSTEALVSLGKRAIERGLFLLHGDVFVLETPESRTVFGKVNDAYFGVAFDNSGNVGIDIQMTGYADHEWFVGLLSSLRFEVEHTLSAERFTREAREALSPDFRIRAPHTSR